MINSVLGGLVGVTASCAVLGPTEAMIVGFIGGSVAIGADALLKWLKVDDPVGAAAVHFFGGMWGVLAVGIFGRNQFDILGENNGLLWSGSFYLVGVQLLGIVSISLWSAALTAVCFFVMKFTIGIRMAPDEEIMGADWCEHRVRSENFAHKLEKALGALKSSSDDREEEIILKVRAAPNDTQRLHLTCLFRY